MDNYNLFEVGVILTIVKTSLSLFITATFIIKMSSTIQHSSFRFLVRVGDQLAKWGRVKITETAAAVWGSRSMI